MFVINNLFEEILRKRGKLREKIMIRKSCHWSSLVCNAKSWKSLEFYVNFGMPYIYLNVLLTAPAVTGTIENLVEEHYLIIYYLYNWKNYDFFITNCCSEKSLKIQHCIKVTLFINVLSYNCHKMYPTNNKHKNYFFLILIDLFCYRDYFVIISA